jgi:hypothetical protein
MNTNPSGSGDDGVAHAQAASESAEEEIVIPPMITLAEETFLRELPELLKLHYGEWVAYHGDKRYGFAKNKTPLHQRCVDDGLPEDEFIVYHIDEDARHEIRGPILIPWL